MVLRAVKIGFAVFYEFAGLSLYYSSKLDGGTGLALQYSTGFQSKKLKIFLLFQGRSKFCMGIV